MERNSMNKLYAGLAAVLVVLGVGLTVYALNNGDERANDTETSTASPDDTPSTSTTPSPQSVSDGTTQTDTPAIVFTDKGFEQQTYTFPVGTAIMVKNESSMDMQFSSDDHPAHRENPELNMKVLGAGESGTFTPPGKGTYEFHDHINDQYTGTLIIE